MWFQAIFAFVKPIWDNPVTRKIALWCGLALAAYIGYRVWKAGIQNGVRRQMNAAQEKRDMQSEVATVTTQVTIERTLNDHIEAGRQAAAAAPPIGSPDELRRLDPESASRLLPKGGG